MRKYLLFVLVIMLMLGCGSASESENNVVEGEGVGISWWESFPKSWVNLKLYGGQEIILDHCDYGLSRVELTIENGNKYISLVNDVNKVPMKILAVEETDSSHLLKVVNEDVGEQELYFLWKNEEKKMGKWGGMAFVDGPIFVPIENKDFYSIFIEDCDSTKKAP